MNDELPKLVSLLNQSLNQGALEQQEFVRIKSIIEAETDRIKKAFIKEVFGMRKEKHVERYIQYHQATLVELIDSLVAHLNSDELDHVHEISTTPTRLNMLKIFYQCMEDLLTYIEKHFAKYFNQHAKSPESYRYVVHRDIKNKVPDVRYALEKKRINRRLLTMVLNPLDNFISAVRTEEVSYKRMIYLKELLLEVEDLSTLKLTGERLDYKLCLSMGYLNYNSPRFFKYVTTEIHRIIQEQETLSRQLEKLAYFLKIVNQVPVKPGFTFNEKFNSIKDQLSVWISEEIYFFEKRQQLTITFPDADDPVQKDFKLKLNLSVAQLACLLRGLKDIHIITNNNMLEVIRFFASIVQTKQTESVSWESLRTKFYNTDEPTRENIKDLALSLFNYFRKPKSK
ncbi:MAG: hypothetical protein ABL895_18620 [Cyclobacteriaceae bacterium]